MLYLALSVSAATVFGQLMKLAIVRRDDLYVICAANYVTAGTLGIVSGLATGEAIEAPGRLIALAIPAGVMFIASFVCWLWSMQRGGLYVSTVVFQLNAAVPVLASLIIWAERPAPLQWLGMLLLVPAFVLLAHKRAAGVKSEKPWSPWLALALFLTTGLSTTCIKVKHHIGLDEVQLLFFGAVFAVAALIGLAVCFGLRSRFLTPAVAIGAGIGLSNFITVISLGRAVEFVAGYIVFPVQAAGAIVLAAVLALTLWREHLTWRGGLGIALALGCVVLLVGT